MTAYRGAKAPPYLHMSPSLHFKYVFDLRAFRIARLLLNLLKKYANEWILTVLVTLQLNLILKTKME